jgi:hypothetical protein
VTELEARTAGAERTCRERTLAGAGHLLTARTTPAVITAGVDPAAYGAVHITATGHGA